MQQVLQLLLLRPRSVRPCARPFFAGLFQGPLTEPPPPPDDAALAELAGRRRPGGAAPARPQPRHPRGRRGLVQRLRAGDPRAEQRVLRPGALRHPLRRLAAPRRRAAGHRPGDRATCRQALEAHLRGHAGAEMGGRGRATAPSTAASSPAAMPSPAASPPSSRSICTSAAARRRRCSLLAGLLALLTASASTEGTRSQLKS